MGLWKFLHILGVVLMVGNVITTGLWAHWAKSMKEEKLAIFAAESILKADLFLTFVGGGLILIPGFIMLKAMQLPFFETQWLLHGTAALLVSTLIWLLFLLPDQYKMKKLARQNDLENFEKTYHRWSLLGWGATIPLIYGIWVMVVK